MQKIALSEWVVSALQYLPYVVGTGGWLLVIKKIESVMSAHSISLSAQRIVDQAKDSVSYRFAIQNNESLALTGERLVVINILDDRGRFDSYDSVAVMAGKSRIAGSVSNDKKSWSVRFWSFPAYDTWTLECRTNREAANLRILIEDLAENPSQRDASAFKNQRPVPLSIRELSIPANQQSAFGGRIMTPEWWWMAIITFLLVSLYVILLSSLVAYQEPEGFWNKFALAPAVAIYSVLMWFLTRRRSPLVTQGYFSKTENSKTQDPTN